MKRRIAWLASAGIAYSSPHVFSVADDLLAFPQYEIVFSESYISEREASSRLSDLPTYASPVPPPTDPPPPSSDLLHIPPPTTSTPSDETKPPSSPSTYERMILHSTPYLCAIPSPPSPSASPNNTTTNATISAPSTPSTDLAELARATDRGWDLLQEMSGTCLYFVSGWWSYQFCYARSVKQFHPLPPGGQIPMFPPVEDPTTPSYILGKFGERKVNRHRLESGDSTGGALDGGLAAEAGEDEGATVTIQARGGRGGRFLSQKLSGGTTCDLTGAPRRVEIQFHCHPQSGDRIGWIKEVSTCTYLMVVYTPRLCNDVAFLPKREEVAEKVVCKEVVGEGEEEGWRRRKSKEAERLLVGEIESGATTSANGGDAGGRNEVGKKLMVGDIEVGGMKLVGGDKGWLKAQDPVGMGGGLRVEKDGTIVPAGHAIAHQHKKEEGGAVHRLNDKEMAQLGVDVRTANSVIKQLQELRGTKGWKLEAFKTDEGKMELRGIFDDGLNLKGDGDSEAFEVVFVDGEDEEEEGSEEAYEHEL